MRLAVYTENVASVDVRVALGRRQTDVAQKFLNSPKISSTFQQVSGEAVAEGVRTDLVGQCGLIHPSSQDGTDTSIC